MNMSLCRISSIHPDPAAAVFEPAMPLSQLPGLIEPVATAAGLEAPALEIWIGYTKNRRHYLDKQLKAPNTEQQLCDLREYSEAHFSKFDRFILRWIYCQVRIVEVGELHVVSFDRQFAQRISCSPGVTSLRRAETKMIFFRAKSILTRSRKIAFCPWASSIPRPYATAAACFTTLTLSTLNPCQ
jgi:hypothetical protein